MWPIILKDIGLCHFVKSEKGTDAPLCHRRGPGEESETVVDGGDEESVSQAVIAEQSAFTAKIKSHL